MSTIPERLATAEDEIKGLESMIDARSRKLWAEIVALKAIVADLRAIIKETRQ